MLGWGIPGGPCKRASFEPANGDKYTHGDSPSGAAYIIHHVMDSRAEIQSDCGGHNEPVLFSQVLARVLHAKPVIMLMLDNTKYLVLFWGLLRFVSGHQNMVALQTQNPHRSRD